MKQKFLTLLMILIFAGNGFSQSQPISPVEVFYKFWEAALSNDIETAKKYAFGSSIKSNDYEQIRRHLEIISADQLKITRIESEKNYPARAFVLFRAKGRGENVFSGQALLYNQGKQWKIVYLELKPGIIKFEPPKQQFPFWIPDGTPVKKDCPKCG